MPRRRAFARRSARKWGIRALLAVLAAFAGFTSLSWTLGSTLKGGAAERAHALAPGDGRITALLAQQFLSVDATAADRTRADRLAREALRQDPTAVAAVSTLGLNAQLRGDTSGARRLFAYAEQLSRRHLQTQLWAIEDAVDRGNIQDALRNYDIALRTSKNAQELLFPVLASAIAEPTVRSALIKTIASGAGWGAGFIDYVGGRGPDPRTTASFFLGLRQAGIPVAQGAAAAVMTGLIATASPGEAWTFYATVHGGSDRRSSRDVNFTAGLSQPSPFDWNSVDDAGATASIQRGHKGGVFDFSVPSSGGGPMLRQLQMLPPGTYRLEGHSIGIDQPEDSRPYWTLTCQDGRELGRVVLPNSAQMNGIFSGEFTVSAQCPVQALVLVARPSDAVSGSTGQIDRVRLSPVR